MTFSPDTLPSAFPIQWGRYRLMEELGRGGTARVYRASLIGPAGFRKPVAVKLLTPEGDTDSEVLLREARIGAQLRHPHIVDIYDCGFVNRRLMIVMELIDGLSVSALLDQEKRVTLSTALDIVGQVCAGLEYAHDASGPHGHAVVHLDLKPANLMVDALGHVRIVDFGIAGVVGKMGRRGRVVHGTPGYMAPEVAFGQNPDVRADLFALGMILAQLVLGRLPWRLDSMAHFRARIQEDSVALMDDGEVEALEALHSGLGELVWECLQRDPRDRIGTVEEFRERLTAFQRSQHEPSMLRTLMRMRRDPATPVWSNDPTDRIDSVLYHDLPTNPSLPKNKSRRVGRRLC